MKKGFWFASLLLLALFAASSAVSSREHDFSVENEESCQRSFLEVSHAHFQKILDDLSQSYDHLGGEITSIKSIATNVYVVSIAQEERVDLITYELEQNDDGSITIKSQKIGVKSNW